MSAQDTKAQIRQAVALLLDEVPAARQLKLVIKLELAARGGDAPIWRVELPGPEIERSPAADSRVHVVVSRPEFNHLAEEGTLRQWARAYERGHVKIAGEPAIVRLLGSVAEKRLARS